MTKNNTTLLDKKIAVIWTCVHDVKQLEGLKHQAEVCRSYANKNDIVVDHVIHSTSDAGHAFEEYRRLLEYIAQHPCVDTILITGYDRLSRVSAEAIAIKCFLKEKGIKVTSVTQLNCADCIFEDLLESIIHGYSHLENVFCNINKAYQP